MADLMSSAVAVSRPEQKRTTQTGDRITVRGLGFDFDDGSAGSCDPADWPPGLLAAYEEGYLPLLWLGRGSSAEVWRCVDGSLGTREVAIKFVSQEAASGKSEAVRALVEEAELLGRLHHPGIVRAVRRSSEGLSTYLVLDFVDGEDLIEHSHLLRLDAKARLLLFTKILDAVAYLHNKDIVHGDLKPEHVLIREDDQPVIIDFGLSSYDSGQNFRLESNSRVGGTGSYRAPEIISHSASTTEPQQDVYSLGVMLRELLHGVAAGEMTEGLEEIIKRAIQADPDNRFPNGGAMLASVRALLFDRPVQSAETLSESSRTARPILARPQTWLAVAAICMLLILAPMLGGLLRSSEDQAKVDRPGPEVSPRTFAQASILDLALSDIYSGNPTKAQALLAGFANFGGEESATWESRHLEALISGTGVTRPYGDEAYDARRIFCADFDPESKSIAYAKWNDGSYEVWARSAGRAPQLLGNTTELILAIAISPGAEKLATIDQTGQVTVWPVDVGEGSSHAAYTLPRQQDDRVLWFGPAGESLLLFSPSRRVVESWPLTGETASKPTFVITGCDHAYPLSSGEEGFLVATAGQSTENGKTMLRLFDAAGTNRRALSLEDGQLPASADTALTRDAVICLGMPDGYVRIHNSRANGWQTPCDLGVNSAVPAVALAEDERRVFAALGRINVIDLNGKLLMRLGDRNAPEELITQFHFSQSSGTLTSLSIKGVWQCLID